MDAVNFSDALSQEVAQLTRQFTKYNRGGFQMNEVLRFTFECVDTMADMGTRYLDLSHQQQKEQVVETLRTIYTSKNPDLPWIGEPFESLMEQALFSYIVPELFSVLVTSKLRKQDARSQGESQGEMPEDEGNKGQGRMRSQDEDTEQSQDSGQSSDMGMSNQEEMSDEDQDRHMGQETANQSPQGQEEVSNQPIAGE